MKAREINLTGKTSAGGQLFIADQAAMQEFFKSWPNSKVILSFKIYQPGTSEALKGYYYNKIVPDFKRALWEAGDRKTAQDTELFLRELCPILREETPDPETGKYTYDIREISDLDNQELCAYIDHLKQIAAEEFYFFIEDPQIFVK